MLESDKKKIVSVALILAIILLGYIVFDEIKIMEVSANGKVLGYYEMTDDTDGDFLKNSEIEYGYGNDLLLLDVEVEGLSTRKVLPFFKTLTTSFALKHKALETLNLYVDAGIMTVDENSFVIPSREIGEEIILEAKKYFAKKENASIREVDFKEDISIENEKMSYSEFSDKLLQKDKLLLLLTANEEKLKKYTVKKGDTASTIVKGFEMTLEELKDCNPNVDIERLKLGQTLNLEKSKALLTVVK